MEAHTWNPSMQEVEAVGSRVQDQLDYLILAWATYLDPVQSIGAEAQWQDICWVCERKACIQSKQKDLSRHWGTVVLSDTAVPEDSSAHVLHICYISPVACFVQQWHSWVVTSNLQIVPVWALRSLLTSALRCIWKKACACQQQTAQCRLRQHQRTQCSWWDLL